MRSHVSFLLGLLAALVVGGCTTIHQVAVGAKPDEFYAVASSSFLSIPGPSYIIHCTEINDPMGKELSCERVLVSREAGKLSPGENPGGRARFVRDRKGADK